MFAQFKTLPQLFDFFKDEATCMAYWEQVRWNGNPTCPHCQAENPYKTNRGYKCRNVECQKKFSLITGSIFENTKMPLRTWFGAMYLCANHKKGISSLQLSRDLGIHQKSAWFLLHRIRETFKEIDPETLGGSGVMVETDTTIVGGKVKNMSNKKRKAILEDKSKRNDNKTNVSAYIERGGKIRFDVVDASENEPDLLRKHVDTESVLMTDTANTYVKVGKEFAHHGSVDHSKSEYCRDSVYHTNTIEGAFSHFDRMVIGVYHNISRKHMQAYCNESAYRYNTRKAEQTNRFENTVAKAAGVRLKYVALTGKA
ncbi:IS1595 family transposase [Flavipsychrobacter stenotrophus]|uniref:IS1595 family transposase n=1 Tax=Flavipsychrobacter stenotrophus TaxID=2077091 RepID=A0A2S7SRZ2_9BACT|nr:IS1595 family transposase [Flavipsychrobacter stenotrophus]PQJ09679.1 IS1595 family transposase [Flavipsychrobacter stenotrophus]